jgi:hypothetical protein
LLIFLASQKIKGSEKMTSFSHIRKFEDAIVFGVEQAGQILRRLFHWETDKILKAFKKEQVGARREGKGRERKGRERKGKEGKGKEGKGRERKGRERKGREGKGKEGKGREGKGILTIMTLILLSFLCIITFPK